MRRAPPREPVQPNHAYVAAATRRGWHGITHQHACYARCVNNPKRHARAGVSAVTSFNGARIIAANEARHDDIQAYGWSRIYYNPRNMKGVYNIMAPQRKTVFNSAGHMSANCSAASHTTDSKAGNTVRHGIIALPMKKCHSRDIAAARAPCQKCPSSHPRRRTTNLNSTEQQTRTNARAESRILYATLLQKARACRARIRQWWKLGINHHHHHAIHTAHGTRCANARAGVVICLRARARCGNTRTTRAPTFQTHLPRRARAHNTDAPGSARSVTDDAREH